MPSVSKEKFKYLDEAGDEQTVIIDFQVDRYGMFRALIPDFIVDTIKANKPDNLEVASGPKWWRLEGARLADVRAAIVSAFVIHNEPTVTTERVIRYTWGAQAAFVFDENGVYAANGYDYAGITGTSDSDWQKSRNGVNWAKLRRELSVTFPADGGYQIRLFAAVFDKTTTVRGKAVKTEYRYVNAGCNFSQDNPALRLNAFNHGGMTDRRNNVCVEEMPYTDEAALWFYNALIGMCRMAHTIDTFFRDKEAMQRAIATGSGPLMITGSK